MNAGDTENAILQLSAVLGGDYAEGCFSDAEVANEAGRQLAAALHELAEIPEALERAARKIAEAEVGKSGLLTKQYNILAAEDVLEILRDEIGGK